MIREYEATRLLMPPKSEEKPRLWVKIRLPADERGFETQRIIKISWKRRAPTRVMEAIELYEALLQGDTTLLKKHFGHLL